MLQPNYETLRQQIAQYCRENHIFGVLRVTIRGKVAYEQHMGFADWESETPFTDRSMFTLYSLSKPFCAIGLMKLRERGLVDLDAHPAKYVPEAEGFDPRLTVRHLLHHTSGLPDFSQNEDFSRKYYPGQPRKAREHLKLLTGYPAYFAPGTAGLYENVNFILCALIIENVSSTNYASYMRKEVFEPLGMKNALVDHEYLVISNRVTGYALKDNVPTEVEKNHSWLFGAGDMVATVDDVYCLNRAIKHRLLLSEETWQEILTPSPLNKMGMGCTLTTWHGKQRITHNGGSTGFRTLHIQLPEDDFDLIFLSNSGYGDARHELAELVHTAFYGSGGDAGERVEMDKGYAL